MIDLKEKAVLHDARIFGPMSEFEHEQVMLCHDKSTGLKAIIAIHNTILGPGLGGTRFFNYSSENDALRDVLRLSRGMTYKAAISGLNLGGAKAVIIGDPKTLKSEGLFRKFGRFIENLNGKYITAEDVGTTTRDMEYISMETKHVVGLPEIKGGGGDPSPVTAYGVFMGMKASAKYVYGSDSLKGKTIAVQGIGKVGYHLVEYLYKEGAKIYISDINTVQLQKAAKEFGAIVVDGNDLFDLNVDIFAPCAMGAILNTDTIGRLKCSIISGAANNQLEHEDEHGSMLKDKGIIYAPDFLINAGGLINVYSEHTGYNRDIAMGQAENIYDTTLEILKTANSEDIHTQKAAIMLAENRLRQIKNVKSTI
ncbi:MAG: Glu/Leu/Phe/Val dehydrogenase dimerization domain-containing protein [Bacteroidia bacterium]